MVHLTSYSSTISFASVMMFRLRLLRMSPLPRSSLPLFMSLFDSSPASSFRDASESPSGSGSGRGWKTSSSNLFSMRFLRMVCLSSSWESLVKWFSFSSSSLSELSYSLPSYFLSRWFSMNSCSHRSYCLRYCRVRAYLVSSPLLVMSLISCLVPGVRS